VDSAGYSKSQDPFPLKSDKLYQLARKRRKFVEGSRMWSLMWVALLVSLIGWGVTYWKLREALDWIAHAWNNWHHDLMACREYDPVLFHLLSQRERSWWGRPSGPAPPQRRVSDVDLIDACHQIARSEPEAAELLRAQFDPLGFEPRLIIAQAMQMVHAARLSVAHARGMSEGLRARSGIGEGRTEY
jgi:hypothetical protein